MPTAMGYGMLALSPLGAEFVSHGVLAGLYAVICGGIIAVLLGANTTMIYGPRSIVAYMTAALVLLPLCSPTLLTSFRPLRQPS